MSKKTIQIAPVRTIKAKSHYWGKITKTLHIHYCYNCGLVALKNEASRRAIKAPCPGEIDLWE